MLRLSSRLSTISKVQRGAQLARRAYVIDNPIVLPPLPYDVRALEPHISATTVEVHYGKHHAGYVTKLNNQLEGDVRDLPALIQTLQGPNFNLAAQIWNHTFYWECMAPSTGGKPTGKIAEEINGKWGSFETFQDEFTKAAFTLFGSGWAWLVRSKTGELVIMQTSNADCPIRTGQKPLLTCDVWEHAYYIDQRHDRMAYIKGWWNLVNWNFVNKQYIEE